MSKFSLILLSALLGCLVSGGAAGTIRVDTTGIQVVDNIHVFAAQYPGLQIQQMEKEIVPAKARVGSQTVRYNMGARIPGKLPKAYPTFDRPPITDPAIWHTFRRRTGGPDSQHLRIPTGARCEPAAYLSGERQGCHCILRGAALHPGHQRGHRLRGRRRHRPELDLHRAGGQEHQELLIPGSLLRSQLGGICISSSLALYIYIFFFFLNVTPILNTYV